MFFVDQFCDYNVLSDDSVLIAHHTKINNVLHYYLITFIKCVTVIQSIFHRRASLLVGALHELRCTRLGKKGPYGAQKVELIKGKTTIRVKVISTSLFVCIFLCLEIFRMPWLACKMHPLLLLFHYFLGIFRTTFPTYIESRRWREKIARDKNICMWISITFFFSLLFHSLLLCFVVYCCRFYGWVVSVQRTLSVHIETRWRYATIIHAPTWESHVQFYEWCRRYDASIRA